jgi:RNA polymerase sigma-70 factor, ECF subfamily
LVKSGLSAEPLASAARASRLSGQEQQRLADLYQANFASVFRLCHRILKSLDDAADATHETFLLALDSMPASTPKVARSWLLTVARNHCIDLLRRRKRADRYLATFEHEPPRGSDVESTIANRDLISEVLNQLPLRERQALWQSAVESRPIAEIATGLRLNYMAAAQVLHRARRHAADVATRLAVVIGIAQLGRALRPRAILRRLASLSHVDISALSVERVLAAAAVPLVAIAIQSSSSTLEGPSPSAPHQTTQPSMILRPTITSPNTLLINGLGHVVVTLPTLPVPTPSLPALPIPTPILPALPVPTPSLPALPVPTASLPPLP